jgi:hypothetical protein
LLIFSEKSFPAESRRLYAGGVGRNRVGAVPGTTRKMAESDIFSVICAKNQSPGAKEEQRIVGRRWLEMRAMILELPELQWLMDEPPLAYAWGW